MFDTAAVSQMFVQGTEFNGKGTAEVIVSKIKGTPVTNLAYSVYMYCFSFGDLCAL